MEPGSEPLRSGEQIDIACDKTRINMVIGLLSFRVLQSRFLKTSRVRESMDVGNVDQLNRCIGVDTSLPGCQPPARRSDWMRGTNSCFKGSYR